MLGTTALLSGLIDYAGLFPPAGLDMPTTVRNYDAYRRGPHAWMLGRLIVPASRLAEFEAVRTTVAPDPSPTPWRLSALLGAELEAEADLALAFHDAVAERRAPVVIDAWEAKVQSPDDVYRLSARVPGAVRLSCEIPVQAGTRSARASLLNAIFHAGATAKARTGGVTPASIPTTAEVAGFVWDCACAGVPFKATAGLHHRVRGEYRLTYAPDSPVTTLHGFLNVFAAAAIARGDASERGRHAGTEPPAALLAVLEERDPDAFGLDDEGLRWRDRRIAAQDLGDTRAALALSFGSCSFEEPVAELLSHGLPG